MANLTTSDTAHCATRTRAPHSRMFAALLFTVLGRGIAAQSPAAEWRTITTPHFRVHYTAEAAGWAERAASRLESVRSAVVKEVGFAPEKVTDVLVVNPVADSNGITLPLLDAPRIVYFTEPPDPESTIGEYSDWIDLLAVHETTHLVHLMRPSRNPPQRLLERLLPLNPITLDAPRWVLEGYATVVEGRITGSGRPNSALRAAILRKWAISGRLPSYPQLNSGHQFLGMSMAYLAGSAYLEWLERRSGGDALRHLWARMTARQRRSFDAAFSGVFGESPSRLYGQFIAEVTANAMAAAKSESFADGALWQETTYDSGDPAVSPDGSKLAMVTRNEKGDANLLVLSTGANEEDEKLAKRIETILKRDPEDVAPLRNKPLKRKPLFTLEPSDGGDIETPRWSADGAALIYTHRQPDRDGFLHRDLFRWTPGEGRVERLTRLADVHDADPLDATHAVAVRNRGGASQLVTVDLSTGEVTERTPPSLEIVYARPRAARDRHIAWSQHDHGGWHVVVDGHDAGPRGTFDPDWGSDGTLYAVRAENGFLDIVKLAAGDTSVVAHAGGALQSPAAAPDGSLYFMSLEPDGFVVRRLAAPVPVEPQAAAPAEVPAFATFESQPSLPPARTASAGRSFQRSSAASTRAASAPRRSTLASATWLDGWTRSSSLRPVMYAAGQSQRVGAGGPSMPPCTPSASAAITAWSCAAPTARTRLGGSSASTRARCSATARWGSSMRRCDCHNGRSPPRSCGWPPTRATTRGRRSAWPAISAISAPRSHSQTCGGTWPSADCRRRSFPTRATLAASSIRRSRG